jgi:hypothetical protein
MSNQDEPDWIKELKEKLPVDLVPFLDQRDGAVKFLRQLPIAFLPEDVCTPTKQQRTWELVGLYYLNQKRIYEALPIFSSLYDHMLTAQDKKQNYCHKGMPLVWIAECYSRLGFPAIAKRYLMLTLCEDAITGSGNVSPEQTGIYFRLVWGHGLPDEDLKTYSTQMFRIFKENEVDGRFPEWILQELGQDWMREFTSPAEAVIYASNTRYIKYLISKLDDKTGENLERLAEYILSCMPGCRTRRRGRSRSTDYDIVCSMEGLEVDFRSEFGRYFVCECKDWERAADFTTMAKFCRVLDSIKSRFGILFSKEGISGTRDTTNAAREQLKVFQDRGMVIVVVDKADLTNVAEGNNFINMLRMKYESVRLDLYKLK